MDKNTIIGFVLIALIMMGFMGYQARQQRKQQEYQAQLDSIAAAEAYAQWQQDSIWRAEHPQEAAKADSLSQQTVAPVAPVYSDSLLNLAARAEEKLITLSNEKLEVVFTTRGAQPYSVMVKDYFTYEKDPVYLLQAGKSELGYVVYAPSAIDTRKFTFQYIPEASSDSTVVMRLPLQEGGYIEQKYTLLKNSYSVNEALTLVNLPFQRSSGSVDVYFDATLPRMEKGYKNETQYSRLNYYFPDDNKPANIGNGRKGEKRFSNNIEWFAFQQQFFSAIMRAPQNFSFGDFAIDFVPKEDVSPMTIRA